jgi:uncharacterized protein YdiU (UPF0061 family)
VFDGGHQFGQWAGQLGDGRAINIAEIDIKGVNWKFQLKGAGPTPYSRGADGLAVIRSSIREYLCSEAMHNLGVPTTRALSLVKTGNLVTRDKARVVGTPKLCIASLHKYSLMDDLITAKPSAPLE